jgi:hypothetical protein
VVSFQRELGLDAILVIPSEKKIQMVGSESIDGLTEQKKIKLIWILSVLGLWPGLNPDPDESRPGWI